MTKLNPFPFQTGDVVTMTQAGYKDLVKDGWDHSLPLKMGASYTVDGVRPWLVSIPQDDPSRDYCHLYVCRAFVLAVPTSDSVKTV